MSGATSVPCGRTTDGAAICGLPCRSWRSCPIPGCKCEIARCDEHGGDVRAMGMMVDHVSEHVTSAPATSLRGFEVIRNGDGSAWNIVEEGVGIAWSKSRVQAHRIVAALAGGLVDFAAFADAKTDWAAATFGPQSLVGLRRHIDKELAEIDAKPGDLEEWVDLILLALDGAMRVGAHATGADVARTLEHKMAKNRARTWPDWRTVDADAPREHDRTKEP